MSITGQSFERVQTVTRFQIDIALWSTLPDPSTCSVATLFPRFRPRPKLSYDQTMQTEMTSDQTFQTEVTSDQTFQTDMISDQTFLTKMSSDQTEPRPLSRL